VVLFSFEGPIGIEFRELDVVAGDELEFCHGLHHVNGTKTDGTKLEMWWRTTLCLRRIEGSWTINHSHDSVPFNMDNGMASLDLKP
jgi:ketosteroid isomerase-like protein